MVDESQPAGGGPENIKKWTAELAAAGSQILESIEGDTQLHPGISAIAQTMIRNAMEIVGDHIDAKQYQVIKDEKILSAAIERALELLTTDRPPTGMEIGLLRPGIVRAQYDAADRNSQGTSRTLQSSSVESIRQELATIRDLKS